MSSEEDKLEQNKNALKIIRDSLEEMKRTKRTPVVIIVLLIIIILFQSFGVNIRQQWEYKQVRCWNEGYSRSGSGSEKATLVNVSDKELKKYGEDGWELVNTYSEVETAFPNFGDSKYVNGIQPNVRPQAVVLIFKRPAKTIGFINFIKQLLY